MSTSQLKRFYRRFFLSSPGMTVKLSNRSELLDSPLLVRNLKQVIWSERVFQVGVIVVIEFDLLDRVPIVRAVFRIGEYAFFDFTKIDNNNE
jgi:hypothetical protein